MANKAQLNLIVLDNNAIKADNLKILINYSKISKIKVSIPEHYYKGFGRSILKDIRKYYRLIGIENKPLENRNKLEKNLIKLQIKLKEVKALTSKKISDNNAKIKSNIKEKLNGSKIGAKTIVNLEKQISKIKDKLKARKLNKVENSKKQLLTKLKNSCLTGQFRVSLNEFVNNSSTLFNENNLDELRLFAKNLKISNRKVFNKSMDFLNKAAKAEYNYLTEKQNKFAKNVNSANKIKKQLLSYRTNFEDNYYGSINNIKGAPVNPNRFICLDKSIENESIHEFFDKVIRSDVNKDKMIYELTVNFKNNNKNKSLVCSFDNKKSFDLMKAKMLTAIPSEDTESIEVNEKTIYFNKKFKMSKTIYDLKNNPNSFYKNVAESKAIISEFEKSLEQKEIPNTELVVENSVKENKLKVLVGKAKNKVQTLLEKEHPSKQRILSSNEISSSIDL